MLLSAYFNVTTLSTATFRIASFHYLRKVEQSFLIDGGQWGRMNEKIRTANAIGRERHASDSARQREGNWQLLDTTRMQDRDSTRNLHVLLKLKCGGTSLIGRRGTMLPSIRMYNDPVSCYSRFRVSSTECGSLRMTFVGSQMEI